MNSAARPICTGLKARIEELEDRVKEVTAEKKIEERKYACVIGIIEFSHCAVWLTSCRYIELLNRERSVIQERRWEINRLKLQIKRQAEGLG